MFAQTIRDCAFALLCVACLAQGRRVQDSRAQLQPHAEVNRRIDASKSNFLESLGRLLLQNSLNTQKKQLQLKYFDARGAAETARLLFALGGEEYEDVRFEGMPAFQAAKESGELKMNLNRAPVLVTESGVIIGQSKAIERFLAHRFGLMGKDPTEEALIDSIAEHCRDVKDAQGRKGFSAFARDKTDEEKAAARSEWFNTDFPAMLAKIDDAVQETGSPGFAVGSSLSYADVAIFSLLRDGLEADKEDALIAAEKCGALNAIADTVHSHPLVAKWLEGRPQTSF